MAHHFELRVGHGHAEVLVDDMSARNGSNVLEDALTTVTEARSLDGAAVEGATQLVQQDGSQRFAVNVLSDDEQRAAGLHDGLQQRNHFLDGADLHVRQQDVRIVQDALHALHVRRHVGGDVATVVLHALDDVDVQAEGLGLLDGDSAVLADSVHGLGNLAANLGGASGDGADVGNLVLVGNRGSVSLDSVDHSVDCLLDAATDAQRVSASSHVAQALGNDSVGQQRSGGGAVACDVVRLHRNFADQLGAHVLDRVGELDLLRNGNAVVGDQRSTVALLEGDVAALGAKGHLDRVRQLLDAGGQAGARIGLELNVLCHVSNLQMKSNEFAYFATYA